MTTPPNTKISAPTPAPTIAGGAPHPSGRARDQLAVDRAIAELRRGGVVVVRAGRELDRIALITAAEMTIDGSLDRLSGLAGSEPSLAITGNRAAALGMTTHATTLTLALSPNTTVEDILALADPIVTPGANLHAALVGATVLPEREDDPAAVGLRLAKLARILPCVMVATVPSVTPAGLEAWAFERSLLVVEQPAIDAHRAETAARLVRAGDAKVPLADAENTRLIAFRPLDGGTEHIAIQIGPDGATDTAPADPTAPVLVRLHSQCVTGDLLGSLRCDCGDQLRGAIRTIAEAGGGILLYLAQEGRGIGLINKLKAYALQDLGADTVDANTALGFDDDERVYFEAAEMLRQLGVDKVRLLTNNPRKMDHLAACGVEVVERVAHVFPSNRHNEGYLRTKAERSGHLL
jgi:GTP cyclohydrolase II